MSEEKKSSRSKRRSRSSSSSTGQETQSSNASVPKNKAQKVVTLRNRFFYTMYKYSMLSFLTSFIAFVVACVFVVMFANKPQQVEYIPTDEAGMYIEIPTLDKCFDDKVVQRFTLEAASHLFKYDYINYADQMQQATEFFSLDGWNRFLEEFKKSRTLDAVRENQWVVTSKPTGVPVILKKQMIDGVCTWDVKLSIGVSYLGHAKNNAVNMDMYFRISRLSVINNPRGLGITTIIQKFN